MKQNIKILGAWLKKYCFLFFAAASLLIPDILLRNLMTTQVFTEPYVAVVRWLFTAFWCILILSVCFLVLPKKAGRIVYIVITGIFIILSFSQYVYFKIFNQYFWLKSIALVGEGAKFAGYAVSQIDVKVLVHALLAILFLVLAAITWKAPEQKSKKRWLLALIPIIFISGTHIYMQPELHNDAQHDWDWWKKPRVVYKNFNDINKSFEVAGLYQLTFRDLYKTVFAPEMYGDEEFLKVDKYFEEKGAPATNEYTGIFKGKNVIAVMMESVDNWMINKTYTPTLYKMMKNGIHFSNYHASIFGAGCTFNSEFAFNTGYFTPKSAVSAVAFSTNSYPYSLANLFRDAGYTTNSFHFNNSEFYNRGIMHKSFGYEKYNSLTNFGISAKDAELDSNMPANDAVYEKMVGEKPFFNFIITYSAHLPYDHDDSKLLLAKEKYPHLINKSMHTEKNNSMILAADTDEFFRILLNRLEQDGILEDTVIVAYTDHYAYGLQDQELLSELKEQDEIIYRVPAFIYAPGMKGIKITKPMMTIDWLPTLVNLFDLSREGRYIGNDIFSPENKGFVYYDNAAWLDDTMYYTPDAGEPAEKDKAYVKERNNRVQESMEINDIVISGNYYGKK